ncbi:TIGR03751 family conjugal transfer lipoprotein [Legionella pneumophila]|uniref:TIGR03751 family conjugal transfer lipoprotein n=1 Tax=Legionella pneumophila TaxID=446 RepID=UPI000491C130|nr:TIGR03751 family conjugal transfer lipoprotein [Legionella pneumophila]RYB34893.1 TIGR03751 family conjugal transfer lipoprotein [Legionella pneumophila]RYW28583.1 TIGR03751 family conjugal transfer lipoprotein [Legionella pneumophila]HAT1867298.1 TIGR03751 family conjugal transfer lipoprotein [Legionella pneumophila]HAT1907425.1 TIGR03751 family conjugal transfer lipoprotein [Legionella pneumophila]HAT1916890.1 TIGR03751 family conjugal transfer lipoprotein [Legionella pneumophila]
MVIYNKLHTILVLGSAFILSSCASNSISSTAIPEGGLTVSQLYQQSLGEPMPGWSVRKKQAKPVSYAGYTREASNEIQNLFKPLDNPQVPIYVFPHVALIGDEQLLKPGYTTGFFLYKQNQFALASERY